MTRYSKVESEASDLQLSQREYASEVSGGYSESNVFMPVSGGQQGNVMIIPEIINNPRNVKQLVSDLRKVWVLTITVLAQPQILFSSSGSNHQTKTGGILQVDP